MAKTAKPDFIEPVDHNDPEVPPAETPKNENVSRAGAAPTELTKSDVPEETEDEDSKPKSYVWLANGEIRLCYTEDLPQNGGGGEFGHWNENGKVHSIVGIYPYEETVKKG